MFHIGQQVVCVDALGAPQLVKGDIYTVTLVLPVEVSVWRGVICEMGGLLLEEAEPSFGDVGFATPRFRPVKPTSIEVFRQLLVRPPKAPVREDASA
jgi:hypothetical protein